MKNIITELLSYKGMEQIDLRKEICKRGRRVNQQYLNRVINSEQNPSFMLAYAISIILGKPIEDIFFPTEEEVFRTKEKSK